MGEQRGQRRLRSLFLLFPLVFLAACSAESLSLFFDIPPPSEQELRAEAERETAAERAAAQAAGLPGIAALTAEEQGPRPEIESVLAWSKAKEMLPTDKKGRVDWSKAERLGVIKPRDRIDSRDPIQAFVFKYDFFIPAEDPEDDAFFPHSTHTRWLACESCHPKLFPLRAEKYTKSQMKEGRYCGACHTKTGGATFSLRACDRCHLGPVVRATPQAEEGVEEADEDEEEDEEEEEEEEEQSDSG